MHTGQSFRQHGRNVYDEHSKDHIIKVVVQESSRKLVNAVKAKEFNMNQNLFVLPMAVKQNQLR